MSNESGPARLSALAGGFSGIRMLVVGDLMLDEYIWGSVSRISPEAPVPVVNVTGESYYPGGAANVARNAHELTSAAELIGICGQDQQGERLVALLNASGIATAGIQRDARFSTIVKTRIIARNQQIVRVDRERRTPLSLAQTKNVMQYLDR